MTLEPYRIAHFGLREGDVMAERYELAGLLGSGVDTVVFRAHDLSSGDEIAVKVFRATALQDSAALKAFKRHLTVLRDAAHANVVQIFDFGEIAGTFYVAMELVRGEPLSCETRGGTWPHVRAIEMLEQLTDALAWLHSGGVVHGDVRTTNLVWNRGTLKLMDFGPERDFRWVTPPTPDSSCPYASPDRLLGRPLTPASDLYSAAAVIYHLLVGEPPLAGVNLLKGATPEALPLRTRVLKIPDEFAAILERCLDPNPSQRPASTTVL